MNMNMAGRIAAEAEDSLDEELELELDDERLDALLGDAPHRPGEGGIGRKIITRRCPIAARVDRSCRTGAATKAKVVVISKAAIPPARAASSSGITQRLNRRICRVVALSAPSERGSRMVLPALCAARPAGGAIGLFDRSGQPARRRARHGLLHRQRRRGLSHGAGIRAHAGALGITLIKYWFSITDDEQQFRFTMRVTDPLKQWKLSPMDANRAGAGGLYQGQGRHARAYEIRRSAVVDRRGGRREAGAAHRISHLRSQIPYHEIERPAVVLPARVRIDPDYLRGPIPERCTCRRILRG